MVAWTERSDIPGDYDHLKVQHPDVFADETENQIFQCADAPDDYYDEVGDTNDQQNNILDNAIKKTINKFSKYDFTTGKLFNTKHSHRRICNKTEHELIRIKQHRKKITLSNELLKLVRVNLDDQNLTPRVTISRIRQALKAKLRQSMISNSGKDNQIVNETKITELVNKSFKKRLHHQFWKELLHKHVPQ